MDEVDGVDVVDQKKRKVVCVNAEHGGIDSGAVGQKGLKESCTTLRAAYELRTVLDALGYQVVLARENNTQTTLNRRVNIAEEYHADLMITLACNDGPYPPGHPKHGTAHGFEVFTTKGDTAADPIATEIFNELKADLTELAGRADREDGDPDKEEQYYVLRKTTMPAVLVEMAFITNPTEEDLLRDPVFLGRMARAIAHGADRGLGGSQRNGTNATTGTNGGRPERAGV